MAGTRRGFERNKFLLKCYWKFENVAELQRNFKRKFENRYPIRLTISRIGAFDAVGAIQNVLKLFLEDRNHKQVVSRCFRQLSCKVGHSK